MDKLVLIKTIIFILWAISIFAVFMSIIGMIIMAFLPEEKTPEPKKPPFYSLAQIEQMYKDKNTDTSKMEIIVHSFVEHHPLPEKENEQLTKKAKHMLEMIFTLSGHSHMTEQLRSEMFRDLKRKNPEYKDEFKNAT